MNHTDRPLSEKIQQVKNFCTQFNEEKTKYYPGVYLTNYYSDNGEISETISNTNFGLVLVGVYTRAEIIEKMIDYFGLFEGNQKDKTTRI